MKILQKKGAGLKNILILEDNDKIRERLVNIIRNNYSENQVTIYAYSSTIGIYDAISNNDIDVFMVDIMLAGDNVVSADGLKFVEKIRAMKSYEFTPVIFVTSIYDQKLYAYSDLHSYKYIEKPFKDEMVLDALEGALRFPKGKEKEKNFRVVVDGTIFIMKCSEIVSIESFRHKIIITDIEGGRLEAPYKVFDEILNDIKGTTLYQCSRYMIINKDYVTAVNWTRGFLRLKNVQQEIKIGRTFKESIREILDDL